jgi:hypothetical protein
LVGIPGEIIHSRLLVVDYFDGAIASENLLYFYAESAYIGRNNIDGDHTEITKDPPFAGTLAGSGGPREWTLGLCTLWILKLKGASV